jgi:dipeptidyl aminopeptidase/acylaminoacyl peptidase
MSGAGYFHISANGTLVYVAGGGLTQRSLVWVGRQGAPQALPETKRSSYDQPRLSPDGKWIAFASRFPHQDLWALELASGAVNRLTFTPEEDETPAWTPDGRRVTFVYQKDGAQILSKAADGSGKEELLWKADSHTHLAAWSPDGKFLAYSQSDPSTDWDIWLLPGPAGGAERKPVPFLRTPAAEVAGAFSPDGRWLVYTSNESGRFEIYVRPVADPAGGKWQISTDGGMEPAWARHGGEIFYRNEDSMMVAAVQTAPVFRAARPQLLFQRRYASTSAAAIRTYDVSADSRRFFMLKESDEATTQLHVVLNWFEDLKQRLGAARP